MYTVKLVHYQILIYYNIIFYSLHKIILCSFDLKQQVYDKKVFQVIYNTTIAAEHAVSRINGFEYPPGHPIILEFSSSSL